MNNTYILIDTHNLFHRAKHANHTGDIDMRIGMTFHIMLNSIKKAWADYEGDHIVFCLEGRSWRKDYYKPYKLNRKAMQAKKSPREMEDDEIFMEALASFVDFLERRTNVTVLQHSNVEADDLIATWIQTHGDDQNIIISGDSDFYQLISDNVWMYDGVRERTITKDGFFDKNGKPIIDKKTGKRKEAVHPEYELFFKCVRGDTSDNIFSAYPGARVKSSKNKVGINEAFEDRIKKGYAWNNFMNHTWTDKEGKERTVKEEYETNQMLVDLSMQPEEVKEQCINTINIALERDKVSGIGIHFLRFCKKWGLDMISKFPHDYTRFLSAHYKGH